MYRAAPPDALPRRNAVTPTNTPPSPPPRRGSHWRWLCAIAATSLLYRGGYVASVRSHTLYQHPVIDAAQHHAWATRIANGCIIGAGPDDVFKPPLYPSVVGAIYAAIGAGLGSVQVAQHLLGAASAVLTTLLGFRLFGTFVGLTAGLTSALYAPYVFFEGQLLTPALSIFLNLAFALALLRGARTVGGWCGMGALSGLAAAVRPDAILAMGLALAQRLGVTGKANAAKRTLKNAAWLMCGLALAIGPVAARNYALTRSLILVSSNAGVNFHTGNGPRADGLSAVPTGVAWSQMIATVPEAILLRPDKASRLWLTRTLSAIREAPLRWAALLGKKAVAFWNGREFRNNIGYDWFRQECWTLRFPFFQYWPVSALCLIGIGLSLRKWREQPGRLLPVLMVTGYWAVCVAFFVTARFRMPAVPFMILLAASAIEWLRDCARRSGSSFAGACLAVAVTGAATWPGWFPLAPQGHARDLINLGNVRRARGQPQAALDSYRRAEALAPQDPEAPFLLGTLLLPQRRPAEALEHLARARTRCPTGVDILLNTAEAHRHLGNTHEAMEAYSSLLRLRETRNLHHKRVSVAKAHLGLAELHASGGRRKEARREIEQAWQVSEQAAAEYALIRGRDLARAKDAFGRLVADQPWDWYLRSNLGMSYLKLDRPHEAVAELTKASKLRGSRPGVRFYLGLALLRSGRRQEAKDALTDLLTDLPASPLADQVRRTLRGIRGRPAGSRGPVR